MILDRPPAEPLPRVIIPKVASRPAGYVRHVAFLAGAKYQRSRRGVPMAILGDRNVAYFGRGNYWALFDHFEKVGVATTGVSAAAWLLGVSS